MESRYETQEIYTFLNAFSGVMQKLQTLMLLMYFPNVQCSGNKAPQSHL